MGLLCRPVAGVVPDPLEQRALPLPAFQPAPPRQGLHLDTGQVLALDLDTLHVPRLARAEPAPYLEGVPAGEPPPDRGNRPDLRQPCGEVVPCRRLDRENADYPLVDRHDVDAVEQVAPTVQLWKPARPRRPGSPSHGAASACGLSVKTWQYLPFLQRQKPQALSFLSRSVTRDIALRSILALLLLFLWVTRAMVSHA